MSARSESRIIVIIRQIYAIVTCKHFYQKAVSSICFSTYDKVVDKTQFDRRVVFRLFLQLNITKSTYSVHLDQIILCTLGV